MKLQKKGNGRQIRPLFRDLFDDFWGTNKFFEGEWLPTPRFKTPAVNIKDNDKDFEIEVAAPGLAKDDFEVTIENGILCVSSEKEEKTEEKTDNYTREEFNYSAFSRSFALPENVDPESVDAKYKDGVLKLTLKKLALATPETKKIQIK
ncbi:MAG: Hsp20/alpha crystallin family protein [Saprospiraceae bacterium]|nr:Hsp20/alpha crystallin family protein [Saprospiraceae bacterium]